MRICGFTHTSPACHRYLSSSVFLQTLLSKPCSCASCARDGSQIIIPSLCVYPNNLFFLHIFTCILSLSLDVIKTFKVCKKNDFSCKNVPQLQILTFCCCCLAVPSQLLPNQTCLPVRKGISDIATPPPTRGTVSTPHPPPVSPLSTTLTDITSTITNITLTK